MEPWLESDELYAYGYLMLILQPALPLQQSHTVKMRKKVKLGMENGGWLKVVALRSKEAPNMHPLDNFRN